MRNVLQAQIQGLPPGELRDQLSKIETHHPEIFTVVGANIIGSIGRYDDYPREPSWMIEVYAQDPTGVFNAVLDTFEPEEIPIIRDHLRLSGAVKEEQLLLQNQIAQQIDALQRLSARVEVLFESGLGNLRKQEQSK